MGDTGAGIRRLLTAAKQDPVKAGARQTENDPIRTVRQAPGGEDPESVSSGDVVVRHLFHGHGLRTALGPGMTRPRWLVSSLLILGLALVPLGANARCGVHRSSWGGRG